MTSENKTTIYEIETSKLDALTKEPYDWIIEFIQEGGDDGCNTPLKIAKLSRCSKKFYVTHEDISEDSVYRFMITIYQELEHIEQKISIVKHYSESPGVKLLDMIVKLVGTKIN